jgi:hypothetical protein
LRWLAASGWTRFLVFPAAEAAVNSLQPREDWEQVAPSPELTGVSAEQAVLAVDHHPEKVPAVSESLEKPAMAAALQWIQGVFEPVWAADLSSQFPANLTKAVDHLVEGGERCAQFPSWAQT